MFSRLTPSGYVSSAELWFRPSKNERYLFPTTLRNKPSYYIALYTIFFRRIIIAALPPYLVTRVFLLLIFLLPTYIYKLPSHHHPYTQTQNISKRQRHPWDEWVRERVKKIHIGGQTNTCVSDFQAETPRRLRYPLPQIRMIKWHIRVSTINYIYIYIWVEGGD